MNKNNEIITPFAVAVLLVFSSGSLAAVVLSNGEVAVRIQSDNGVIDKVSFGGVDWYDPIPHFQASDWGLQVGGDISTFQRNAIRRPPARPIQSISGIPVTSVTPGPNSLSAEVDATYSAAGSTVSVKPTYSLLEGINRLRVETTLTNESLNPVTLRQFDTYYPNPGFQLDGSRQEFMDVAGISTPEGDALLGQAWIDNPTPLSVAMGSTDPRVTIASGPDFIIRDGWSLNHFFSMPVDAEGDFHGGFINVGFEFSLHPGSSETLTFTQVYGDTPADNVDDFLKDLTASVELGTPIIVTDELPLPAAFPLFGSAVGTNRFFGPVS